MIELPFGGPAASIFVGIGRLLGLHNLPIELPMTCTVAKAKAEKVSVDTDTSDKAVAEKPNADN